MTRPYTAQAKVGVRTLYGVNHAVLGAAGGFLAGTYLEAPFTTQLVMAAIGTFGGLLPDADTKSSLLGRLLPNFWHKLTPGHRGLTHSLLYCAAAFGVALALQLWWQSIGLLEEREHFYYPIALTVGALTHLFADSLTVQGVPFFYPFWKRKIKLLGPLSFKTGSRVEPAVVTVLLAIAAAYVLMPHTDGFVETIDTPAILGPQTEQILLFMTLTAVSALVFTVYSRSRKPAKSKRRKSKSRRR